MPETKPAVKAPAKRASTKPDARKFNEAPEARVGAGEPRLQNLDQGRLGMMRTFLDKANDATRHARYSNAPALTGLLNVGKDIAEARKALDDAQACWVAQSITMGASWAQVAAELGITKQAAHMRYAKGLVGQMSLT